MDALQKPSRDEVLAAVRAGIRDAFYEFLVDSGVTPAELTAPPTQPTPPAQPTIVQVGQPGTPPVPPPPPVPEVPSMGRRNWTAHEHDRLLRLHADGLHPDVIAARMGRTSGSVMTRLRGAGLVSPQTERRYYSEDQKSLILQMHTSGRRPEEIAAAVGQGRCANDIISFLRYRGLLR